jgi:ubiquinol-cytochrome c reductase cytochrome c1 subunit
MLSRLPKLAKAGAVAAAAAAVGYTGSQEVQASADRIIPESYPFDHRGWFQAYDMASVRRGHLVYSNVCATCHSMNLLAYRNFVDACYTEEEVRVMCEDVEVVDGPDEEGEMFERAAKLSDKLAAPYRNEAEARFSNGGALPPDLSLMAKARPEGEDYLFALLTGYRDAPTGVDVMPGMHYNPYFSGGQIAMPPPLSDGLVDYPEGGPEATVSQMAKDVSVFLTWAAEPAQDERKLMGVKWLTALGAAVFGTAYYKRFRWNVLKSRRISYK